MNGAVDAIVDMDLLHSGRFEGGYERRGHSVFGETLPAQRLDEAD
jgi:hypothetical protein